MIDGSTYVLGDYIIRIGSCRKGNAYKGIALQVLLMLLYVSSIQACFTQFVYVNAMC